MIAMGALAMVGLVFGGLVVLGAVVFVSLFIWKAKRDGTLEPESPMNRRK